MPQLWSDLANQVRITNPVEDNQYFQDYNVIPDGFNFSSSSLRRSAVICPVNNNYDFAAARNAHLFKERFESAWDFDSVVVEEGARSSQAKPSAAVVAVLVPLVEALLSGRHPQSANKSSSTSRSAGDMVLPLEQRNHLVIIYITCSTPVDIAEIYDGLAQCIIGQEDALQQRESLDSYFPTQAAIIVDAPCTAPLQVAPGAQLPIPLMVPRADFDGHIALKFLHAAHSCGDDGGDDNEQQSSSSFISLEKIASRISPIATLMGAVGSGGKKMSPITLPWNRTLCPSTQSVTYFVCTSLEPLDKETLGAIDGRNVGKALKQQMPSARLRYMVEKEQCVILNFNAEDTFRPPEIVLHHEDCAAEFEAALAGAGIYNSVRLGAVLPSADRRMIASVVALEPSSSVQNEVAKLFKAVTDQSIRMQVPLRIPSKTFLATNLALAYKYEVTSTYRSYLLLEALVRLHMASPEHRLRIEDLTPPVITTQNVDVGSVSSFMYVRAGVPASVAGVSPRRQMFIDHKNNNSNNNTSSLNVSAASPLQLQQQQQQQQHSPTMLMNNSSSMNTVQNSNQENQLPVNVNTSLAKSQQQSPAAQITDTNNNNNNQALSMMMTKKQNEELTRQIIREELANHNNNNNNNNSNPAELKSLIRQQVQESNMQMASQFQSALEQLRAEFYMELRKSNENLSNDIRETESRWKKHLLLIENRLQKLEEKQQQQQYESPPRSAVNNNNAAASPITIKREIASALESLGTPLQQLDQKVASVSSRLDATNERLLSLEELVSTNQRNMSSAQDTWMTQRDQQLQQFSQTLTDTLEQRLSNFVPEGRMRIVEERLDEVSNNNQGGSNNANNNASPSRALADRLSTIESTAEQAKRDCASFEQKLSHLEDGTKRLISQSEETVKTNLSTSVNRFSTDLSQRLVSFLNDSISRVNTEIGSIKTSLHGNVDTVVSMKVQPILQQIQQQQNQHQLSSRTNNHNDEEIIDFLQASAKRSSNDLKDLRIRVQELEIGKSQIQQLSEEEKAKVQRILALEEQVGRLTNYIRNM